MIIDTKGNTTIITRERASVVDMVQRMTKQYDSFSHNNIIVNLFSIEGLTNNDLNEFLLLSRKHRAAKHSFVIVASKIDYTTVSDDLVVVPTAQEAHDLVEMDEIERDLGF
ncbi:ribonuclease Z [Spongiivirga citrea]|uniref:Ribonuclease Z n=1 Tax=Spongiivirga citrea TaxID=1481457 RepID=A0A6M0CNP2_9FLAO|nr:ribonuclease Z [Spongiivirga citrea]NER17664.1 ribonuclease Z [Spongiivirga citrea]